MRRLHTIRNFRNAVSPDITGTLNNQRLKLLNERVSILQLSLQMWETQDALLVFIEGTKIIRRVDARKCIGVNRL